MAHGGQWSGGSAERQPGKAVAFWLGRQQPHGPVGWRLGRPADRQWPGSSVGVAFCLFFQCIMMCRKLPWARDLGC
jgi:hypothetical protein